MRHVLIVFFVVFFWTTGALLVGCGTTPSPLPPDLTSAEARTFDRTAQIQETRQWVERNLRYFAELRVDHALSAELAEIDGFPLSLYRLMAVACLNEEIQPRNSGEINDVSDIADCNPVHSAHLGKALAALGDGVENQTLESLARIDEMRKVRGLLRLQVARIPQVIQINQSYLVEQRAELRQLHAELVRRRSLYSREDFAAAQAILDQHRPLLGALEDAIESLTVLYPEWADRLDQQVSTLYMDLANLR